MSLFLESKLSISGNGDVVQATASLSEVSHPQPPIFCFGQQFGGEGACAAVAGSHALNQFPARRSIPFCMPLDCAMKQIQRLKLGTK